MPAEGKQLRKPQMRGRDIAFRAPLLVESTLLPPEGGTTVRSQHVLLPLLSLLFIAILAGCAAQGPTPTPGAVAPIPEPTASPLATVAQPPTEAPRVVRLMTHDSFNVSEEVVRAFETANNARLEVIKAGDAGSALNQAILSKENPLADAFFGVDNTFLGRALENDLFVPYEAEGLDVVLEEVQLDPEHRVTPIDYGDVCLNYDKSYFEEQQLAPPTSLEDLVKPAYRGLTVVENPATSSPGLAFLITTIGHFGEPGWEEYWQQLRANDVVVTDGWEDAYYGQFSGGSGEGTHPIVVSYASSPPAEVFFAEPQPEEAPTAALTGDETCFRQIEFAGVLRNAQNPDLAQALIDFMLSLTFQEDIPLQMFVFPVNPNATLPEVFVQHAAIPETPVNVGFETINANREQWIERWTDIVLR